MLLDLGNNSSEMNSAHFYGSLQVSATLAGWIKRPPLLGVSPPREKNVKRLKCGERLQGMYVSRPDYYLKGCESAGLVRQKANRARGSRRETNLRRVHMERGELVEICTLPSRL